MNDDGTNKAGTADSPRDDFDLLSRLTLIDEALKNAELVGRIRRCDQSMVMQIFYVRKHIVGNGELPLKTRMAALDQLEDMLVARAGIKRKCRSISGQQAALIYRDQIGR